MNLPPSHYQLAQEVEIAGRHLRFSNLDKVLWPESGFTKGEMLSYYRRVAPFMLPHIAGRPMVSARFPDGVEGDFWFQTACPDPPAWMRTCSIPKAGNPREAFDYCVIDDEPSLLWLANLGAIELHPLLSKADLLDRPSNVVFDIDPGPGMGILECCTVALSIKAALRSATLSCYPKSTGSQGLHVYVPLNSSATFGQAKAFARNLAARLTEENPDLITDRSSRGDRREKVFVDWAQNNKLRSVVAPYSLRAMPLPSVAAPLLWEEIEATVRTGGAERLIFLGTEIAERVEQIGDPLQPVMTQVQELPSL